jgi:hypothetical protein
MKSKLLAVAAFALLSSVANASTVITLDFEDGTAPVNGPVPVYTYNVGGVSISFANATYSDLSGAQPAGMAIAQVWSGSSHPPITVTFDQPVRAVSVLAIGGCAATCEVTNWLRAYGAGDVLLATDTQPVVGAALVTLAVVADDILKVTLDGQLSGFKSAFDNLTVRPTPLPAALPLFATGLGALGLLGWRRKRKAN